MGRLRQSNEWRLAGVARAAAPRLSLAWWALVVVRGLLPAAFAISMGVTVAAVEHGDSLALPLALVGVIFVATQALGPLHDAMSANLGALTSTWLHERLLEAST